MIKKLTGTGVALVTPFTAEQNIDFNAFKAILQHTQNDVNFWVLQGTTGESVTCSENESVALLNFLVENNENNLPIVMGLGGNNTQKLVETCKSFDTQKITAFLSVSPYYNRPTQEGIYQHYAKIADASPIPIILYNVPPRTGSNIKAETTLRLAQHGNIIGIKEASNDVLQCLQILKHKPKDFFLFAGDDALTVPLISLGAEGVIGVLPNAFPKEFSAMTNAALAGNFKIAQDLALKFADLYPLMFEEGNPTGIKQALAILNLCLPKMRLPMIEASSQLAKKVRDVMIKI